MKLVCFMIILGNVTRYLNFLDRMVLAHPLSELAKFLACVCVCVCVCVCFERIELTWVQNGPVEFEKTTYKRYIFAEV